MVLEFLNFFLFQQLLGKKNKNKIKAEKSQQTKKNKKKISLSFLLFLLVFSYFSVFLFKIFFFIFFFRLFFLNFPVRFLTTFFFFREIHLGELFTCYITVFTHNQDSQVSNVRIQVTDFFFVPCSIYFFMKVQYPFFFWHFPKRTIQNEKEKENNQALPLYLIFFLLNSFHNFF